MRFKMIFLAILVLSGCSHYKLGVYSSVRGRQNSIAIDKVVADADINRRLASFSNCVKASPALTPAKIYLKSEKGSNLDLSSQGGMYEAALMMTQGTKFDLQIEKGSFRGAPVNPDFRVITSEISPEVIEDASLSGSLYALIGWGTYTQYQLMRIKLVSLITDRKGKLLYHHSDSIQFLKKTSGSNYDVPARVNGTNIVIGASTSGGDYSVELQAYALLTKVHAAKVMASIINPRSSNSCRINLLEEALVSNKTCLYGSHIAVCGNEYADWQPFTSRGINRLVFSAYTTNDGEVSIKEVSSMDVPYLASGGCYTYVLGGLDAGEYRYQLASNRVDVGLARTIKVPSCAIRYPEKFSKSYAEQAENGDYVRNAMREIVRGL